MFYSNWEKTPVVLFLHCDCIIILNPQIYLYWLKLIQCNGREEMNDFELCEKLWELSEGWTEWLSGIWVIIYIYGTALPVPGYQDPLKEKEMHELKYWFPNVRQNPIRYGLKVYNTKFGSNSFAEIYPWCILWFRPESHLAYKVHMGNLKT